MKLLRAITRAGQENFLAIAPRQPDPEKRAAPTRNYGIIKETLNSVF